MLALHHSTLPWSLHEQGLICLPNEEPHILERIRIGEHIEHYETVRLSKNANLIDISLSVSPVKDAEGKIIGASKIARDITERKRAEAHQDMLTRELHHRTKNVFTVVQAVICRSFAGKSTVRQAEAAVLDRLHSLAQTHVMLIEKDWEGADIAEVVRQEMSPFLGRVVIEGPTVMLNAKTRILPWPCMSLQPMQSSMARYPTRLDACIFISPFSNRMAISSSSSVGKSTAGRP